MIETVRTGSNRLSTDLQQLQSGFDEVSGSLSPRPAFKPDEPAAVQTQAETVDHSEAQAGGLHEPPSGEHAQPAAEDSAAATPASPEAAELESVAGDPGHANGSEQAEPAHHGGDAEGAQADRAQHGAQRHPP